MKELKMWKASKFKETIVGLMDDVSFVDEVKVTLENIYTVYILFNMLKPNMKL